MIDAQDSRDIVRRLQRDGFALVSVRGSHHKFRHADGRTVIVTHPRKDMPAGTVRSIYVQARVAKGLTWRPTTSR